MSDAINDPLFSRNPEGAAHLSTADNYILFFADAMEFSVFPHKRCPPHADSVGFTNRLDAWKWSPTRNGRMRMRAVGDMRTILRQLRKALLGLSPDWEIPVFRVKFNPPWPGNGLPFVIRFARAAWSTTNGLSLPPVQRRPAFTPLSPFFGRL